MLWLADKNLWQRVVSSRIPYSLLRRELHNDLTFCQQHGVGVTPYQSLQGGLLTGKYRRGQPPPPDSRAAEKPERVCGNGRADYGFRSSSVIVSFTTNSDPGAAKAQVGS
jgi:aryl-alcohol dehydrogenase-like predicted oxidoreductase